MIARTWHARVVAADEDFDGAPHLRREFALESGHGSVQSATLAMSALGVVEARLNGVAVSPDVLTPGWSSYEERVRYAVVDVTALVEPVTVLALALGNGWYRGRLGWQGSRALYGAELGAIAELEVTFADGAVQRIGTDESWHAGPGPVSENDLYDGQSIDARRRDDGWWLPGFDERDWVGVHELTFDTAALVPYIGPPVRRREELPVRRVWTSPAGRTLVDFGQNLVGWVRVRATGGAGRQITIRHAEVLEHGELGTRPLRSARATDRYVLSGGEDVFEPPFTFHGFRYVEVDGWPGELDPSALTAVVIGSDLRRIGTFACSDDLLNSFHDNVVWGMRGNFVDVPTDCPQRDERLGWTGDIAAFAPTAAFLFDVDGFLRDWLRDLDVEQRHHHGVIPFVVPDVLKYASPAADPSQPESAARDATALWSDAGVWVPWALWQAYGDKDVLAAQFDSMASHVRRVRSLLSPTGLWDTGFQFGDWLDPDAPAQDPAAAKADKGVVATACAYRSADLAARSAAVLGRPAEEAEFTDMASGLRRAFGEHYVDAGTITSDCTTVYSLAIAFGLLSDHDRAVAGNRLADLAEAAQYRVSTGFAGTPFITDALSVTGHLDAAYRLLTETECPSWLYPVRMGATTVWERWDSMLPDGSINPGEMTSFNHYALGAVADWMHRAVGGLAPAEPGYATLLVAPRPGGGITWARTELMTPHGRAAVAWHVEADRLHVGVDVPEGAKALLRLPDQPERTLSAGHHEVESAAREATPDQSHRDAAAAPHGARPGEDDGPDQVLCNGAAPPRR